MAAVLLVCMIALAVNVSASGMGSIQNINLSPDGVLTWDRYKDMSGYRVRTYDAWGGIIVSAGCSGTPASFKYDARRALALDGQPTGKYTITLYAEGNDFDQRSEAWTGTYDYVSVLPRLDTPKDPHWNGTRAEWSPVEGAYKYFVQLYREGGDQPEGQFIIKKNVWGQRDGETPPTYIDFAGEISGGGRYHFEVMACGYELKEDNANSHFAMSPWNTATPGSGGSVSVMGNDHGAVTPDRMNDVASGERVAVAVTPENGWRLESISAVTGDGERLSIKEEKGKYVFTMPSADVAVEAVFAIDHPLGDIYNDVPYGVYYYDAVRWATENDIAVGTNGSFGPDLPCTRAQTAEFLWRAAGCPKAKNSVMPFADIPDDAGYREAVLWAVEQGITNGVSEKAFDPDGICTRGQIVTFMWRAAGSPAAAADVKFDDVAGHAYYSIPVGWAVSKKMTNGVSDTAFAPHMTCSRAQIITMLYRGRTSH